jgi:carbonic anhydrase
MCSTGQEQSPIDLTVLKGTCEQDMVLDIEWSILSIQTQFIKSDTTINADGVWGHLFATTVDGNLYGYDGTTLEFHAPAEHTIEGSAYDLEMQFVFTIKNEFTDYTRNTAIFSILFQIDDSNPVDIFTTIDPSKLNTMFTVNMSNIISQYVQAPIIYYTYDGSWTTPICNETVNWYVFSSPLGVATTDLAKFTEYWANNMSFANGKGNNRGLQNLNGRSIMQGGVQCQEQFVYFFSFFILYIFINYFIFKLL